MIRIAVLASGGGTNLQALLDACAAGRIRGRVEVVLSNVAGAGALERARRAGAATEVLPSKGVADRAAYDAELAARLARHAPDLVCLAGYMRLLTPAFLRAFGPTPATGGCPRVMNIHPGLLPSFPGLHAARQCVAYGARFAGCTVHFVDGGIDSGIVIAQAAVPVQPGDTASALAARVLAAEHRLYPAALARVARGEAPIVSGRVEIADGDLLVTP